MRFFLTYVVPLVLPTALYFAWAQWRAKKFRQAGIDVGPVPVPWVVLAGLGVALLAIVLGTMALTGGSAIDGDYVPPRFQDGKIVPGHVDAPAPDAVETAPDGGMR